MPLSTAKNCLDLMDSVYYYGMQQNLLWTIHFMLITIDEIDVTIIQQPKYLELIKTHLYTEVDLKLVWPSLAIVKDLLELNEHNVDPLIDTCILDQVIELRFKNSFLIEK